MSATLHEFEHRCGNSQAATTIGLGPSGGFLCGACPRSGSGPVAAAAQRFWDEPACIIKICHIDRMGVVFYRKIADNASRHLSAKTNQLLYNNN